MDLQLVVSVAPDDLPLARHHRKAEESSPCAGGLLLDHLITVAYVSTIPRVAIKVSGVKLTSNQGTPSSFAK